MMKSKKLFLIVLCVLAVSIAFCSCSKASDEVTVKGDTVSFNLEENPTTGFTWAYSIEPPENLIFVKDQYETDQKDEKIAGAGGLHQFEFKAQKPGTVTVTFVYARQWEGGEVEETRTYTFKIADDLTITQEK